MNLNGLPYDEIAQRIAEFIKKQTTAAGASGAVFGLSGGVDSAVTAHLCSRALGSDRCLALIMPNSEFTPSSETRDGILVATRLSIPYTTIQLQRIVSESVMHDPNPTKIALGNLNARLRAVLLYYEAQKHNYLVVGTDDKSEHMLGYFTKYGDGACDILPISSLYKTQVWDLARYLKVPHHIIEKEPGPHLWADHFASTELGLNYTDIDRVLQRLHDDPSQISKDTNIPLDRIRNILNLHQNSSHKRSLPPVATLNSNIPNPIKYTVPWGEIEQFTSDIPQKTNLLHLNPKTSTPYLKNHSKLWRIIRGSAVAILDDKTIMLSEGDDLLVPRNAAHKIIGGSKGAHVLEIIADEP